MIDRLDAARLIVTGHDPEEGAYVEPAHDALIQGWDRLWKWVQVDQDDLLLRQRLTPAAEDWNRNGRKTGQLWTNDPRLKQAEAARLKEHTWLNKVEAEFSDASERQRKKNQRRLIASLTAALIIFSALAIFASVKAIDATNSAATAVAKEIDRATAQSNAEAKSTEAISNQREAEAQSTVAVENQREAEAQSTIAVANERAAATQEAKAVAESNLANVTHAGLGGARSAG